jgi:hypothetical protein
MAASVAKQYGAAMPGTSGTPSDANRYVTDADPRLETVGTLETSVSELESGSVDLDEVLGLVRWLAARVALLEAVVGTNDAIDPPAEAVLLDGPMYEETP